ncbi:TAXI family TRAP transporter solute-binding subunit [Brevibacterium album]|uniref:TAXI family TRAP transporter solute-binding subunit n=1 Tax=Brevibacterium album TaxID=417948 RepID=UPI0003F56387|nr:TAXI family TRAP transporter solute-binding subunit [Brevibacterium album]
MRKLPAVASAAALALTLSACGSGGQEAQTAVEEGPLPDTYAISTYGTGTSTYADTSAVAEALTNSEGASIRVVPSDTAIGRVSPLRDGQALFSRGGDEYIYAFEAEYDFAVPDWGPQDVRMTWAPTAPHSLMAMSDSGIETFADLEGKRVPWATANPSVQNKMTAFLAYAGLTWDDVEAVDISYGDQADGLRNGQIDVVYQQVYGSSLYELDSQHDVQWLDLDAGDEEAVERMIEVAPSTYVDTFTGGPAQAEGEETEALFYTVPVITYADTSVEAVHDLATQLHENFDAYKDVTPTTDGWGIDAIQSEPTQVPFHDGLVQFLDEQGVWTEEAEARNQELIERQEQLQAEWDAYLEATEESEVGHESWIEWKDENLS